MSTGHRRGRGHGGSTSETAPVHPDKVKAEDVEGAYQIDKVALVPPEGIEEVEAMGEGQLQDVICYNLYPCMPTTLTCHVVLIISCSL